MAIQLKHSKTLAKSDGVDNTVVQPSDWNATHTLTAAAGKVLGTVVGSTTVSELPISVDGSGNITTVGDVAVVKSTGLASFFTSSGTTAGYLHANSAGPVAVGSSSNSPLWLMTNNAQRVVIDTSGNVGVGTALTLGTYGKLRIGGTGYQALNVGSDDASGVNVIVAANAATEARIGTASNHPVDIYTNNLARMRIDAAGAVTIGGSPVVATSGTAAQGDVLYHNGTAWVRLAAGTSGQVLKTNGAGANPEWAGAGITLLGTIATTSGNNQPLSGINLTGCKFVYAVCENVDPTANAQTAVQFTLGGANIRSSTAAGDNYVIFDLTFSMAIVYSISGMSFAASTLTAASTSISATTAGTFQGGTIRLYSAR